MASLPWFRMYTETLSDRKIKLVSIETGIPKVVILGVWTGLLILAAESPERGKVLSGRGKPLPEDFICDEIGVDSGDFAAIMASFAEMGMVYVDDNGAYVITKWDERQFKSDDSYARVKKFRAKKSVENDDYEKRFKKQPRNVSRNGPDTDTDTDNKEGTNVPSAAKTAEPLPKTQIRDDFLNIYKLKFPTAKKTEKYWWSQFQVILDTCNKDPALAKVHMQAVKEYMDAERLTVTGPQSIVNLINTSASGQLNGAKRNGTHRSNSGQGSTLDEQPTFNPYTGETVAPRS